MGLFRVECRVENHRDRARSVRVPDVIVDTGSEMTWIGREHLDRIGIEHEKRDMRFVMANGQELVRSIGFAVVRAGGTLTIDEVVFGQPGDLQLLGARTLEGLNLRVDARNKKLVAAGPIIVAGSAPVNRNQRYACAVHQPFRATGAPQKVYPSGEYATAPGKWTFSMMERPT